MEKAEITTITEAMVVKQTWIREEMQNFLDCWENITDDPIDGFQRLHVGKRDDEYGGDDIYLKRGCNDLLYCPVLCPDYSDGKAYCLHLQNDSDDDTISAIHLRKIMADIPTKLTEYFKNIQDKIDVYTDAGRGVAEIIKKLS